MRVGEVRVIDGKTSLVTGGQFMGEYGICNFWYWRTIKKDGTLGKEYKGYDNGEHRIGPALKHNVVVKLKEPA